MTKTLNDVRNYLTFLLSNWKKTPLYLHISKWIEWTILNFSCVVFFAKIEINIQVVGMGKKCNHGGTCLAYSTNFFIYFNVYIFFLHSCRFSICSFDCFVFVCVWCVCVFLCKWRWEEQTLFNVSLFNCFFFKLFFNPFREVRMGFFL